MKEQSGVTCFCGRGAVLAQNSVIYGRPYGNGWAYICTGYPECDGMVGTHPDGRPLGKLIDGETRKLRRAVHAKIDPLWQNYPHQQRKKRRGSVYGWLRRISGLSAKECHVGEFDAEQCRLILKLIEANPYEVRT